MRQRLGQVLETLEKDDEGEPMDAVVRRFWSRAKPLPRPSRTKDRAEPAEAAVVDLAAWARAHGTRRPS